MTEEELLNALNEIKIDVVSPIKVKDLAGLVRIFTFESVNSETAKFFKENEVKVKENIINFKPSNLLHLGRMAIVNTLIHAFGEENKKLVKDFAQSLTLTAKYFSHYPNLNAYLNYLNSKTKAEEDLILFVSDFRRESGIFGMHVFKATKAFSLSGIIDIPYYSKEIKAYLMSEFDLEDNNSLIYKKEYDLFKETAFSGFEFSQRLEKLAGEF